MPSTQAVAPSPSHKRDGSEKMRTFDKRTHRHNSFDRQKCVKVLWLRHAQLRMARNLRQVHDLTPTRVRDSTVVADFADVDMHAPPAFIMFMGNQEKEIRRFSSRE